MLRRIERSAEEFRPFIGLSSRCVEQPFVANLRMTFCNFVLIAFNGVRDALKTACNCRNGILLDRSRVARRSGGEKLLRGCFNASTRCGIKFRVLLGLTLLCSPSWYRKQGRENQE
jgi:hypothetical protein